MAKKRRTTRKPGRKEALAVIVLAMLVGLARQMLAPSYDLSNIPDYDGTSAYAVIDRNQPSFTEKEYTTDSYEYYSELDSLGRCGVAEACVGVDLMPTEERESISLCDLYAGIFEESSIDTDLAKFIFDQNNLLAWKYFLQHLLDQCGLAGSKETGNNLNLCHVLFLLSLL